MRPQPAFPHGGFVPLGAQAGGAAATGNMPDVPMAQSNQVFGGETSAQHVVVGNDVGAGNGQVTVSGDHRRHVHGREHLLRRLGGDHDAVDTQRHEAVHGCPVKVGIERGVSDRHPETKGRKLVVESGQQVDKPEVPIVIQDHANGAGPVAGQRRGGAAGTVVQPFNGLLDGGAARPGKPPAHPATPARPGTLKPRPRRLRRRCSGVCRFLASRPPL